MKWITLAVLTCWAILAQASSTYRCQGKLVSLNATTVEVLEKCGEPEDRQFTGFKERTDEYGFWQEVRVEEWTYGPSHGMYHYLRFEGNRLSKISSKRG